MVEFCGYGRCFRFTGSQQNSTSATEALIHSHSHVFSALIFIDLYTLYTTCHVYISSRSLPLSILKHSYIYMYIRENEIEEEGGKSKVESIYMYIEALPPPRFSITGSGICSRHLDLTVRTDSI